jgi:hypothetical protein
MGDAGELAVSGERAASANVPGCLRQRAASALASANVPGCFRPAPQKPGKKTLTVLQQLNIMCCEEEGCDWGLTCIFVSFVVHSCAAGAVHSPVALPCSVTFRCRTAQDSSGESRKSVKIRRRRG